MQDPAAPHHTESPGEKSARKYYTVVIFLGVFVALLIPDTKVLAGRIESYFALTKTQLGILFGAPSLGGLVGALGCGAVADRIGYRRALRLSLIITAAGALACAGSNAFVPLCAGLLVYSFGRAAMSVIVPAFFGVLYPRHRRRFISLFLVSVSLFLLPMPLLWHVLGRLSDRSASVSFAAVFRGGFLVVAVLVALHQFLLARPIRQGERAAMDEAETTSTAAPWRRWWFLEGAAVLILTLGVLHVASDSTLYNWTPKLLEETFAVRAFPPAVTISLYELAYIICRLTLVALPETSGERRFLILPGIIGGSVVCLALSSGSYTVMALSIPFGALFWGLEYPSLMAFASRKYPRRAATLFGLMMCLGYVGNLTEAILVGRLADLGIPLKRALLIAPIGFICFGLLSLVHFGSALVRKRLARPAGVVG